MKKATIYFEGKEVCDIEFHSIMEVGNLYYFYDEKGSEVAVFTTQYCYVIKETENLTVTVSGNDLIAAYNRPNTTTRL
jgi:hypothetical protein